jgi:hypothetical protein
MYSYIVCSCIIYIIWPHSLHISINCAQHDATLYSAFLRHSTFTLSTLQEVSNCGNIFYFKPQNQFVNLTVFFLCWGRCIGQAVSRWLPTEAARVRVRAACGVCGGQSGTGVGFLKVLRFPLPNTIPPISPSSQSPGVGTIGLLVAAVPSGPDWTVPPTIPIKKN